MSLRTGLRWSPVAILLFSYASLTRHLGRQPVQDARAARDALVVEWWKLAHPNEEVLLPYRFGANCDVPARAQLAALDPGLHSDCSWNGNTLWHSVHASGFAQVPRGAPRRQHRITYRYSNYTRARLPPRRAVEHK